MSFQLRLTDNTLDLNDWILKQSKVFLFKDKNIMRFQVGSATFTLTCFIYENCENQNLSRQLEGRAAVKISINWDQGGISRPPYLYFLELSKTDWSTIVIPRKTEEKEPFYAFLRYLGSLEKQHLIYPHQERQK